MAAPIFPKKQGSSNAPRWEDEPHRRLIGELSEKARREAEKHPDEVDRFARGVLFAIGLELVLGVVAVALWWFLTGGRHGS